MFNKYLFLVKSASVSWLLSDFCSPLFLLGHSRQSLLTVTSGSDSAAPHAWGNPDRQLQVPKVPLRELGKGLAWDKGILQKAHVVPWKEGSGMGVGKEMVPEPGCDGSRVGQRWSW